MQGPSQGLGKVCEQRRNVAAQEDVLGFPRVLRAQLLQKSHLARGEHGHRQAVAI